jgi:hypothetical protein
MMLQPVLDAAGKDAIIIVQGDHGSRMTDVDPFVDNLGKFGSADMIASYSALFALLGTLRGAGARHSCFL